MGKKDLLKDKIFLISGGTGTFGQAMCKRLLSTDVKEIRVFSRDEYKQSQMRRKFKDKRLKFYLGNIRDYEAIYKALKDVDYVFHTAALKQVLACEAFPEEAFKTNVMGTNNIANAAIAQGVEKFVFLSTDKAVEPQNVLGSTKALAEKLIKKKSEESETIFSITRFGNLIVSRGSVVQIFTEAILAGKALNVTNKNMNRFWLSLDEAIDLVMEALEHAKQGDTYVLKAKAADLETLVQALLELFSAEDKIEVNLVGADPSEKLYESLISQSEMHETISQDNYYIVKRDKFRDEASLASFDAFSSNHAEQMNLEEVKEKLLSSEFIQEKLNYLKQ